MGLFGSTAYVEEGKREGSLYPRIAAYLNLDMVGRLREQGLSVQGTGSSGEWNDLLNKIETPDDGMNIQRLPALSCLQILLRCIMRGFQSFLSLPAFTTTITLPEIPLKP